MHGADNILMRQRTGIKRDCQSFAQFAGKI